MIITEKTISNLVESHFPFFFQEDNPLLIEFVKKYYEWLESEGQMLYHARRMSAYKDVDQTVSDFLVYFKEKYLKNIQFQTAASTRRMVKHSLDLYRSKGTARAIDLLFKVVFDTPAEVYLPSRDIFKLSSGDFYEQRYLEVTPAPINIVFVGKQITGLQSGATAFIEKLIRKKIKGIYVEVFTISNVSATHFITGEIISISNQVSIKNNPRIIGSLTRARVFDGSSDFSVGDIVDIESELGAGAKGRVTGVADVTGQVEFKLIDTGFGYSASANIMISEKVLSLSNVQYDSINSSNAYFTDFNLVAAPQAKINFMSLTNTSIAIGDHIYTLYDNAAIKGHGIIQSIDRIQESSIEGNVYVSVLSGNLECSGTDTVNTYYITTSVTNSVATSKIATANLNVAGYEDHTAYGTVIGTREYITIEYANSLPFTKGEKLYQTANNGVQTAVGNVYSISATNLNGYMRIDGITGVFDPNKVIYGSTSNLSANITNVSVEVGVKAVESTDPNTYLRFQFFSNTTNRLHGLTYTNTAYSNAVIRSISKGAGAYFQIANNLSNPETIEINTDFVKDYTNTRLNDLDYAFKPFLVVNINTVLSKGLNYDLMTIGSIKYLTAIDNGDEYNVPPIVKIDEPVISFYDKKDLTLNISGADGSFFLNEIVTQPSTGARGKVITSNTTSLYIRSLSFENSFSNAVSNTTIKGSSSGTAAELEYVFPNTYSRSMGLNAVVTANVISETGSVTSMEIIDSGMGFKHNEVGNFYSSDRMRVGQAMMLLGTRTSPDEERGQEGKMTGRYRNQDGFLSASKKLQDSEYYQEFSYEVRSSITLDKYEAMLKQLLHVAGTKYFAATVRTSVLDVGTTIMTKVDKINISVDMTNFANGYPFTSDTTEISTDTTFRE